MKQSLIKILTLTLALLAGGSAWAEPLRVGMFIDATSVDGIASPQEKAAAQWFQSAFVDQGIGAFITNDAAPVLYQPGGTPKYDVIWINVDRVGDANLPSYLTNNLAAFKKYYNEGHNFYLTKVATKYAKNLGRMSLDVNMCNVATGFQGSDDWLIRLFTENASAKYMSNGLTYTQFADKTWPSYYMHGTGDANSLWREDHNVGWDNGTADGAKAAFESDYNCKVLGTWDHNINGNVALIVEFPGTDGKGTIITNGVAAYQWQANDQLNKYISNVERLTSNTLNYLAGSTDLVMHFPMELHNNEYVYDKVTGTSFHVEGRFTRENVPGAAGQALRFDGYTTQINGTIANTLPEGSTQMTVSLWTAIESYPIVKVDAYSTDKVNIFSCLDDGNKSGFAFGISFEGKWSFKTYVGENLVEISVDTPMPTYQWNNLVAVCDCSDSKRITLYLNGKEVGSTEAVGTLKLGPGELIVGHNKPDNITTNKEGQQLFCITAFNGLIDDVKVWNQIIPLSTIKGWEPENVADLTVPESRFANDKWHPRFHGMPGAGWSNECHGMVYSNGRYHLFFQKNANCPEMMRLHWGHISSENLYDWREEPIAIMPGDSYDIKGCWSGAVFTDPVIGGGKPYIIYTGVDYGHASIVGASPQDADLVKWTKLGELIPNRPDGLSDDFRDPYFFRNGDNAYIIVGTNKGDLGACTLHRYDAAKGTWSNNGDIFFQATDRAKYGKFWEMSNVTKMPNGKWLFTTTPLGSDGGPYKGVRAVYWIGSINADGTFTPETDGKNMELCARNGFGMLSPTIYQHNGKTICLGIVPDILADHVRRDHGYSAHCYSLPRELSIEGETLIQKPYSGLTGLRTATSYSKSNFTVNGEQELGAVNGRSVEICGVFTIGSTPFGFKFFKKGDNEASITYDPSTKVLTLNCQTLARHVNDGGDWDGKYTMPIPEDLPAGSELKLNVFIDHSIVDVFVNDRWASSIRVYPLNDDADGLRVYSTGGDVTVKSLNAWVLDPKASSESGSGSGSSESTREPLKVGMFIDAPSVGEITSPQEKAAAQWFQATYVEQGTGAFITNTSAPELYWSEGYPKYDVVWINVDRVGSSALPDYLIENLAAFKQYYNQGHNFYLTKAASQYAVNLGRISANVDLAGNAEGGNSSGDWWIRLFTEHSSAQFLANGLYSQKLGTNTYLSYGMHGNGDAQLYRENHNTGWNTSSLADTGAKVLGTWDHNTGDVALIVEFPATGATGTIITNGVAAYQWQANDANNLFIDNVERLTANAINFLAGDTNPDYKVAMYIDADRVKTIASQQERSAAEWFKRAYVYQGTGEFITNTTAASTITTDNYKCVWVNLDREGYEMKNLTTYINTNWSAFQDYSNAGGALYLSKMATDMLVKLGRITESVKPTSINSEVATTVTNTNDWWGINPYINYNGIASHGWYRDNSSHPVFAGLQMGTLNGAPFQTYPLIGCATGESIQRYDHNWCWTLTDVGTGLLGDGVNKVVKFEETCVAKVLGTWTHVQDDVVAAMVEFYPINGKGRIIANGASAYQWNDANAYTDNMEQLSDNCIQYLVNNNRQNIYLGMWIDGSNVASIASTQEKNAAEWFMETVVASGNGEFITSETPASVINTTNYKTIWVNISRPDFARGSALPASLTNNQLAFNEYYGAKGNFLLTNYGTVFAHSLGRVTVAPNVWDTNLKGSDNPDVWGINSGFDGSKAYIGGMHPIYNNLTTKPGTKIFPMIGGGIANSTNYNCFWSNSTLTGAVIDPARYRVLGVWDQSTDAKEPTVVQFDPDYGKESIQGCILACGASAYQWTDGNEKYQTNVEIFTLNSLNYLAGYYWDSVNGGVSGAEDVEIAPAEDGPARFFNLQGIEVDGTNLTPGIYIRLQGNKTTKFLVK